ncbi:MAG: hypothetical protein A2140_06915 [Candidatus Muproteobacteria bacterium RBG_16_62_13]|uniref:CARDB domain-containing protein n=1 Tax=Candidatus Muproteobacteria bacterium RBG_16_62_13 TaxID=1817756 RepID=A0A1F6T4V7_9PROT|nr:MAG: hypothetical protein A2140_06915 [Candidatus Muproteobacteria bacterium RBG_16_62_13]
MFVSLVSGKASGAAAHVALATVISASFAVWNAPAEAKEWFPFDMAVADFWAPHENGSRIPAGGSVPEGTVLILHCNWTVRPTEGTIVKKELVEYPNLVTVDGHSRGIFPIKIPPGSYGTKGHTGSTSFLGLGGSSEHVNPGIQELKGEFTTSWTAQGGGPHKLSCILDSAGNVASLEKDRSNNRRDVSITVVAAPVQPTKKLTSPSARHCEPKMDAWVELDTSGLNPADVKPGEKKKVTLPFFSSSPLFDSVACAYGDQKVNAVYLIKCKNAKRYADDPHWYHCEKQ